MFESYIGIVHFNFQFNFHFNFQFNFRNLNNTYL